MNLKCPKNKTIELPIKIGRIRKQNFTEKRDPYKKYLSAKWKWTDIINEIDNTNISLNEISQKYNINYNTLRHKYSNYKNNKITNINDENRGGNKRKITDEQDKEIYEYIKKNYIDTEEILNNNIIKEIIKEKFKDDNMDVSKWWISNFKKRWYLSTQKVKPSKIAVNLPTKDEQQIFLDECNHYKNKVKTKFFSIITKQIIML
jgi:transposase